MSNILSIYTKPNTNSVGMSLQHFKRLSDTVQHNTGTLRLYCHLEHGDRVLARVNGRTSLHFGTDCPARITLVEDEAGDVFYLVHGGDYGIVIRYNSIKNKEWYQPVLYIADWRDLPKKLYHVLANSADRLRGDTDKLINPYPYSYCAN